MLDNLPAYRRWRSSETLRDPPYRPAGRIPREISSRSSSLNTATALRRRPGAIPPWRAIIRDAGLVPRFQRPRESCGDAESAHRSFDKPNRKSSSVGCGHMWTDTYAFQARPFYESMGFVVFGRLDGPAPTFPRFFLMKDVGKMSK